MGETSYMIEYVNLGVVHPSYGLATFEYPLYFDVEDGLIVFYICDRRGADAGNLKPFSDFLKMKNLPKEFYLCRGLADNVVETVAPIIFDQNVLWFNIHLPDDTILAEEVMQPLNRTLHRQGYNSRQTGNDCKVEGKKVSGTLSQIWKNGVTTFAGFVNFKSNIQLMNKIVKKDVDKVRKKSSFDGDFSSIITGLEDENSGFDRKDFIDNFVFQIADRQNKTLKKRKLTKKEKEKMHKITDILNHRKWRIDCQEIERGGGG